VPTVLQAKLASAERVTSAQMAASQTLAARAAFRATMGLRVLAVAAVIVVRGHSRMQDERRAKTVMPARTAPVEVRARTVSRLGFILQTVNSVWCVLLAKVRTVIARDALIVRTVSLAQAVYAHSVLPARLRPPADLAVPVVQRAKLVSVESVTSVQMEASQTLTVQAVSLATMGLRVRAVVAKVVVQGHSPTMTGLRVCCAQQALRGRTGSVASVPRASSHASTPRPGWRSGTGVCRVARQRRWSSRV
jgi:hypothetical protein